MPEADKILSQHEVDALLSAIDSGGGESGASAPAEPYDFRRPSRLPSGPLRYVHALHDGFARSHGRSMPSQAPVWKRRSAKPYQSSGSSGAAIVAFCHVARSSAAERSRG